MKKIVNNALITVLIIINTLSPSWAALSDFADDVKKEETRNRQSTKRSSSSRSSSSSSDDDCMDEVCGELLGLMLAALITHNLSTRYNSYPYQKNLPNQYINFDNKFFEETVDKFEEEEEEEDYPEKENKSKEKYYKFDEYGKLVPEEDTQGKDKKRTKKHKKTGKKPSRNRKNITKKHIKENIPSKKHYLTIDGGYHNARDNGKGAFGSLSSKIFGIIGLEGEGKRLKDKNDDHLDYYAYGANISIFQTNILSAEFYIQRCHLRGILERDGYVTGGKLISYPFRPITLMYKFGRQRYEYIKFWDHEFRIGLIYNRFEVFTGYRRMKSESAKLGGPLVGLKLYF